MRPDIAQRSLVSVELRRDLPLLLDMRTALFAFGIHCRALCLMSSMATKRRSPRSRSTRPAPDSPLGHKILILSFGMLLESVEFAGKLFLRLYNSFLTQCRLRGHRDQITQVLFVPASVDSASSSSSSPQSSYIISTSKDTYLKLWDLNLQHCVQTVVAHRSEVWSCDMDPSRSLILTGSNQGDIKAWSLDQAALVEGLKETREGQVRPTCRQS